LGAGVERPGDERRRLFDFLVAMTAFLLGRTGPWQERHYRAFGFRGEHVVKK
jgi:hypothetical protein